MTSSTPLSPFTVIEIGHSIAAPFAGSLLAQLGAEVIKVEPPSGDPARGWGPPFEAGGAVAFNAVNRDKSSLVIDLKDAAGRAQLKALIADRADVVVQNLRPGSLATLGLSGEALVAENPRLIYCNISAFGHQGPMREKPGYDPLMQAFAGLMSVTGQPESEPARIGFSVVDMGAGLWAALGVLAALAERERTGRGGVVDTSLFETALAWMATPLASYLATGDAPELHGSGTAMIVPYQMFRTLDGRLMIAAGNDRLFAKLCQALDLADLADDPRFALNAGRVAHRKTLIPLLAARLRTGSTAAWIARLDANGVPNAPQRDVAAVAQCDQTLALGMIQTLDKVRAVGLPVSFDGVRPPLRRAAPVLGAE